MLRYYSKLEQFLP